MKNPVKKKLITTGTKRFHAINKWSRTALSRHKLGELETTMIMITKMMVIITMMITKMIVISWKMNRVMVVVVKRSMRMWFQKTSNQFP